MPDDKELKKKLLFEAHNTVFTMHTRGNKMYHVTPQKYPRIFIIMLLYILGIKLSQTWVFSGKLINS